MAGRKRSRYSAVNVPPNAVHVNVRPRWGEIWGEFSQTRHGALQACTGCRDGLGPRDSKSGLSFFIVNEVMPFNIEGQEYSKTNGTYDCFVNETLSDG